MLHHPVYGKGIHELIGKETAVKQTLPFLECIETHPGNFPGLLLLNESLSLLYQKVGTRLNESITETLVKRGCLLLCPIEDILTEKPSACTHFDDIKCFSSQYFRHLRELFC